MKYHICVNVEGRWVICDVGIHLADLFRLPSEPETLDGAEDIVLSGIGGPRRELKLLIDVSEFWTGSVDVVVD